MNLINFFKAKGFYDEVGELKLYNEKCQTFGEALEEWAELEQLNYDISHECVLETPRFDVDCYAFSWIDDEGSVNVELFKVYLKRY